MRMNYRQVFALFQLFRSFVVVTSTDVLNVTILLDVYNGPILLSRAGAGFLVALETIRKRNLLPNYTIRWMVADMGCSVSALGKFHPMWKKFSGGVHAVIGPGCNDACRSIGLFTAAYQIPEVSHLCMSNKLSKRSTYKTFARTVGDLTEDIPKLVLIAAEKFGWRNFHIIATRWSPWFEVAYDIKIVLDNTTLPYQEEPFTSKVHIVGNAPRFAIDVENVLSDIEQQNKPALVILSMYATSAYAIVGMARAKKFSQNLFAFLLIDQLQIDPVEEEIRRSLNLALFVGYGTGLPDVFKRFQSEAFSAYKKEPQLQALLNLSSLDQVTIEDAFLHDALLLWAMAVNQTTATAAAATTGNPRRRRLPPQAWNGMAVAVTIPHISFDGASGFVTLTPNGDRVANYTLGVFLQGQIVKILVQQNSTRKWELQTEALRRIGWQNLRLIPGTPVFDENAIGSSLLTFWIILIALTFVSAVGIIINKYYYEAELKSIQFLLLDYEKLRFGSIDQPRDTVHRKSVFYKSELEPLQLDPLQLIPPVEALPQGRLHSVTHERILTSLPKIFVSAKQSLDQTPTKTTTTCFGFYEDTKICARILLQRRPVNVKDRLLCIEFLQLWKLNHPNINNFIGVCVVTPRVLLCMQFCSRGSVSDIIQRNLIKLTPEFRLALAIDIAQGMKHLHLSPVRSHGHLTSTNCVVDDQWTCKITDHGLCHFRSEYLYPANESDDDTNLCRLVRWSGLLWTAPELLQSGPKKRPICGSQMADVYSFGIILHELFSQSQPFGELGQSLGAKSIVSRVKASEDPPFRPTIQPTDPDDPNITSGHTQLWTLLMEKCWKQDPWQRPPFSEIILRLMIIGGGKLINPVETVIKMLEEHTQKLEEIVHNRSELLYEEKMKAENLLYSVLPVQVAEELKQGNAVNPEEFKAVTIYVSDIVQFTPLAAVSSAIQVVQLLSILFDMYDNLTENFEVYKLETIGDAYVVAGGLPNRNGDLHATQIASLALRILSSVSTFKIPHLPDRPLKIRTGIHTGPVVAGIAGAKMPRYCLFGAAVNTAFAMEASAKPMTINVSDSTAQLLLKKPQFELEKLEVEVYEGDRKVTVYQLLSSNNPERPTPTTE